MNRKELIILRTINAGFALMSIAMLAVLNKLYEKYFLKEDILKWQKDENAKEKSPDGKPIRKKPPQNEQQKEQDEAHIK